MAHTRLPRAAHLLQTKPRGQPRPPRSPGSRTCSAPLPLPARAGLPPASLSASVQPGQPETSAGRPQRTTQAGGAREGRGRPAGPAQRWGQQRRPWSAPSSNGRTRLLPKLTWGVQQDEPHPGAHNKLNFVWGKKKIIQSIFSDLNEIKLEINNREAGRFPNT